MLVPRHSLQERAPSIDVLPNQETTDDKWQPYNSM